MTTPIGSLTPTMLPLQGVSAPLSSGSPGGFQELLSQTWQQTQQLGNGSERLIEQSLIGDDLSMVESFTALRESDLALRLMLQIRNKLVDAYQEIQQLRF